MNTDFIDQDLDEAWECPTCLQPFPPHHDYECGTCEAKASEHLRVTTMCRLLREVSGREAALIVENKRLKEQIQTLQNRRPAVSDTPETDAMCICTHHKSFAATGGVVNPDFARRLENERDMLRSLLTHNEIDRDKLKEQLDAAIMLGKMQERRHERELEQVREQYRLSSVCRRLLEENKQLKGDP